MPVLTPFSDDDLPDAAKLFVRTFNAAPWNDAWSPRRARQRLADILATPGSAGVCLRRQGALAGFVLGHREHWFSGQHFLLQEMCVAAELQRRGHGRALLSLLIEGLDDVEEVYLVTAAAGQARFFYESNGFRFSQDHGIMTKRVGVG